MIIINKYRVSMHEYGENATSSTKSISDIKASSEEEAIKSVINNEWWYNEGTGYRSKPIKYPVTFTAKIYNH